MEGPDVPVALALPGNTDDGLGGASGSEEPGLSAGYAGESDGLEASMMGLPELAPRGEVDEGLGGASGSEEPGLSAAWPEESESIPELSAPPDEPVKAEEDGGQAALVDPPETRDRQWMSPLEAQSRDDELANENTGSWQVVPPPGESVPVESDDPPAEPPRSDEASVASRPSWIARFLSNSTAIVLLITTLAMVGVAAWALLGDPRVQSEVSRQRPKAGFPAFDFSEQRRRGAVTENEVAQMLAQPGSRKTDPDALPNLSPPKVEPPKKRRARRKPKRRTDNAQLDEVLMKHYGGQRPKVGGFAASTTASEPRSRGIGRRFFKPGGTIDVPTAHQDGATQGSATLPPGTRIPARLEVGISSGRHVPVLARVTGDVEIAGRVVVAKGSLLRGRSSNDDRRIYIDFKSVAVDGSSRTISGYAVSGRLPGLSAERREISADERQSTAVVRGVLDTAGGLTQGMGGDVVRDLARNVGRESLGEAEKDTQIDRRFRLEAPAGAKFVVVVTGVGR